MIEIICLYTFLYGTPSNIYTYVHYDHGNLFNMNYNIFIIVVFYWCYFILFIYLFIIKTTNVGEYNCKYNIGKMTHNILITVNTIETIHYNMVISVNAAICRYWRAGYRQADIVYLVKFHNGINLRCVFYHVYAYMYLFYLR